jgi:hypothetical protein
LSDENDARWTRSPFCNGDGSCVEVGSYADEQVAMRCSRTPSVTPVVFTRDEWDAFLAGVKHGHFDHI